MKKVKKLELPECGTNNVIALHGKKRGVMKLLLHTSATHNRLVNNTHTHTHTLISNVFEEEHS
jgi:hypothetical protein